MGIEENGNDTRTMKINGIGAKGVDLEADLKE